MLEEGLNPLLRDGTSKDGTSKDGTSKDGTSKDGTSKDGTSKDGTSTGGTSKRTEEFTVALEYQRKLTWFKVILHQIENRASSSVLGFMTQRLNATQVKMSNAESGVHVQLAELATLISELESMRGALTMRNFDVLDLFLKEVKCVPGLGEQPSSEVVSEFLHGLERIGDTKVNIGQQDVTLWKLNEQMPDRGNKEQMPDRGNKEQMPDLGNMEVFDFSEKEEEGEKVKLVTSEAMEALKVGKTEVLKMYQDFAKMKPCKDKEDKGLTFFEYPVFGWIISFLSEKIKRGDYGALPISWLYDEQEPEHPEEKSKQSCVQWLKKCPCLAQCAKENESKPSVKEQLPFARLGHLIIEALEDDCLAKKDVTLFKGVEACKFRKGVRQIHSQVMPLFQLHLTQMQTILDGQLLTVETYVQKIMAALVTVGVSFGSVAVHYFMGSGATVEVTNSTSL